MWWIYAVGSAFFAALTALSAKVGVQGVNANLATAIRTTVILLITWLLVLIRGEVEGVNFLTRTNWLFLVLSGFTTGLSWLCYFKALSLGKVSQVAPVDKLSVALTIILSVILLGETLTWKMAVGAALIIAGTFVLIF